MLNFATSLAEWINAHPGETIIIAMVCAVVVLIADAAGALAARRGE